MTLHIILRKIKKLIDMVLYKTKGYITGIGYTVQQF